MEIVVHYPTDLEEKKKFNEKVAYFKAFLLYQSVEKLQVSDNIKSEIFKNLLNKLDTPEGKC